MKPCTSNYFYGAKWCKAGRSIFTIIFTVYIDKLLIQLKYFGFRCCINKCDLHVGVLSLSDVITLSVSVSEIWIKC